MKKKIWVINHYSTNTYIDKGGRDYNMYKYISNKEYDCKIFCANTLHSTGKCQVNLNDKLYKINQINDNYSFIFIKTREYAGNGKQRLLNILDYFKNVKKVSNNISKNYGKPDLILGSSVHPLACLLAIQLSKKYNCKNIVEIRDLWPESLIAYNIIKRNSIVYKLMYKFEKYLYTHADKVIMTWAGGYDYIKEQGWDKEIPSSKVIHISNGVDLSDFNKNINNYKIQDNDLENKDYFKFIYTGSIRKVNNLKVIVDAAEILKKEKYDKIKIFIYGIGDELENLKDVVNNKKLDNIIFKGKVEKKYIPYILSKGNVSLLHNTSTILDKYGQSQNKFFEYLAIGHPILMTYSVGHSIIKENKCGIEIEEQTPKNIANAMKQMFELSKEEYDSMCENSLNISKTFDYAYLSNKLINVLEE